LRTDFPPKRLIGWLCHFRLFFILPLLWPALAGCQPRDVAQSVPLHYEPRRVSLGVTGYNYTNREISDFSVNGHGGGNLEVSSPTSGGGGTVCCVPHVVTNNQRIVTVRWQSGACYYHVKSTISDEIHEHIHWFYKEAEVKIEPPMTQNPQYMEVHFYPDGSIKAAVSEHAGGPRLKLPKEREDRTSYPRCPNDKEPID